MLSEQAKFPNQFGELRVYKASVERGELSGLLYHAATERAWRFESFVKLINICEAMFDLADFPQKTHRLRALIEDDDPASHARQLLDGASVPTEELGDTAAYVFLIRVRYRQNASWQGVIKWGDRVKRFRCAMELVKLMDAALGGDKTVDWGDK